MNDKLKLWATGYVAQAIIYLLGVFGVVASQQQKDEATSIAGVIVSTVVLIAGFIINIYSNRQKTQTAVEVRTQAAIGPTTPAVNAALEAKERQIVDPQQANPPPLVQQAVGTTPAEIAQAVESNPELSSPS